MASPPPPPLLSSPVASAPLTPSSSSVFDGSVDHVWISFPEPPHHTYPTSSLSRRPRPSASTNIQAISTPKKLSSYTRYDWNFLSTLSPTVLGWFCVLNRIKSPIKQFIHKREKHLDAVLAYFLIEMKPVSTLPQSKLYELFTPKTRYLLSHPVCQLVTELRKHFNKVDQIDLNLQPNIIPEIELLKQGIREACRGWAQTFKRQPIERIRPAPSSVTTTSPINVILPTGTNDQEQDQPSVRIRTGANSDRNARLMGHEYVVAHPRQPSVTIKQQANGIESSITSDPAVRRRTTAQNTRSNTVTKEAIIEFNKDPSAAPERRRPSNFLGKISFLI